jgi:hypothetical protein
MKTTRPADIATGQILGSAAAALPCSSSALLALFSRNMQFLLSVLEYIGFC